MILCPILYFFWWKTISCVKILIMLFCKSNKICTLKRCNNNVCLMLRRHCHKMYNIFSISWDFTLWTKIKFSVFWMSKYSCKQNKSCISNEKYTIEILYLTYHFFLNSTNVDQLLFKSDHIWHDISVEKQ